MARHAAYLLLKKKVFRLGYTAYTVRFLFFSKEKTLYLALDRGLELGQCLPHLFLCIFWRLLYDFQHG